MKPTSTPSATPPPNDWLQNCGFQSRHDPVNRSVAPGILTQKIDKPASNPTPNFIPIESRSSFSDVFPLMEYQPAAPSSPPKVEPTLVTDEVLSEIRTLRKLSSDVFCPETSRDCIPEVILFGLIALLGMAWPILSMLGVMHRH